MKRGLVFGKFHPPHPGHVAFINAAAAQCDRLTVLLMASVQETIPGDQRLRWLREMLPQIDIRLVPDEMPQSWTAERDDLWREFAALVRAHHPEPIDALFTSEWYGDITAQWLGCRHVAIDPMRSAVHLSSTLIRASPVAYLDRLAPSVRAWCVPRIILAGAESTGKTTLARELAEHYATAWVPEYGRAYTARVGQTANVAYDWQPADFVAIAAEQQRLENHAARGAQPVLICDTDAYATEIWQRRYLGLDVPPLALELAGRRFYLITQDDRPFVQDGKRDGEHVRATMTAWFNAGIAQLGYRFAPLRGSWSERRADAIAFVDAAIDEPIPLLYGCPIPPPAP